MEIRKAKFWEAINVSCVTEASVLDGLKFIGIPFLEILTHFHKGFDSNV
jgi:hypothetical protein